MGKLALPLVAKPVSNIYLALLSTVGFLLYFQTMPCFDQISLSHIRQLYLTVSPFFTSFQLTSLWQAGQ